VRFLHLRVILVEPESGGNIGSVARVMKNFGLSNLWLVNPKIEMGAEAKAFAMHAKEVLTKARIVRELNSAIENCSHAIGTTSISAKSSGNLLRVSITPETLARKIVHSKGEIGIIFGRESSGLSNYELAKCDMVVTVPTDSSYKSLNIANASAIIFYELFKVKNISNNEPAQNPTIESSIEDRSRLLSLFKSIIIKTDMPKYRQRLTERALMNVISRGIATSREVTLIIGALRKVSFLLNNPKLILQSQKK